MNRSRGRTSPYAVRTRAAEPTDERFGVGVAADDPVEGHDVRRFDGGGQLHEVALDELDPVGQVEALSFLPGDCQGRRRPIHEDGMADSRS